MPSNYGRLRQLIRHLVDMAGQRRLEGSTMAEHPGRRPWCNHFRSL